MRGAALVILLAACNTPQRAVEVDAPEPDAATTACDPAAGPTCLANDIVACNFDGTLGAVIAECGTGETCADATCVKTCTADGVDLIYVVTQEDDLYSFDPRQIGAAPFTLIGRLACPTTGMDLMVPPHGVRPFSMAIDRDGVAWVLYTSGEVFTVSIQTAACTATGYAAQAAGMKLFGMGFVSDNPGASSEKLFIAGGGNNADPGGNLATVDTHGASYMPNIIAPLAAVSDVTAELTGTSEARLFGFFPRKIMPAFVQEIDRATGQLIGAPWLIGANGLNALTGWAFAQWGGRFFVFVTNNDVSTVRVIDRVTFNYSIPITGVPFTVVGAGVSTCAPAVVP